MRQFAFITALVVVVALALSFLLLPSEKELGTMLLRDKEYDESRGYFEAQIAAGDTSPQVVTALLEIYVRNGDVQRAIDLVDTYARAIESSPEVLERLTELYRDDRRFGLYLRTLERLTALAPTPERVEELADAYYKAGDLEKRVETLVRLRGFGELTPERLLELAALQVDIGYYDAAIDTLADAIDIFPGPQDRSYHLQLFDLSLFRGQTDRARRLARQMLSPETPADLVIAFADAAIYRGAPDIALDLLHRRNDLEATNTEWRRVHAAALRAIGRDDAAWEKLSSWWHEGHIHEVSSVSLIDLAVVRGQLDLAFDVFMTYGIDRIGIPSALSLIGELHRAGRDEAVDVLMAELGRDALRGQPVLGAEIMLARENVAEANRFADLALATPTPAIGTRLALAALLTRLDRSEEAFTLLRPYVADPALPVEGALLLAELYVRLGKAEDGFWDVAALLASRSTPRLRAVWAQLALATGRRQQVMEWLAREPGLDIDTATDLYFVAEREGAWDVAVAAARRLVAMEPGDLPAQRLAYALFQAGDNAAALAALEPVVSRLPEAEPLYADILLALGRSDALITLWADQIARAGVPDAEREALIYSLLNAGADAIVWDRLLDLARTKGGGWWYTAARSAERLDRRDTLVALAAERVREVNPGSDEATAIAYAVADIDRPASLAVFRNLADRAPGLWGEAYAAILRDLGRTQELTAWTTERLGAETDPERALILAYALADLSPKAAAAAVAPRARASRAFADLYADLLRRSGQPGRALAFEVALAEDETFGATYTRDTAFRALEAGDRSTAERLFRLSATDAAPDSDEIRQLFYLWGPRPKPDALDWIEARARAADGDSRHLWIDRLIDMRAGGRAAEVIGGLDGADSPRALLQLVRAHAQGSDREKLRQAITAAVSRIRDAETLRSLARVAEGTRERGLITETWQAVLRAAPADPEARRTLGLIAYDEGRLIDAERHLGAYLANGEGDYDANYFYADTLARTDRTVQAPPYYRRALAQLLAIQPRDFNQEVTRANLLRRLGKTEEAVALMDALVRQRPGDDGLRADFADLLIESGDLRRARTILQLK